MTRQEKNNKLWFIGICAIAFGLLSVKNPAFHISWLICVILWIITACQETRGY